MASNEGLLKRISKGVQAGLAVVRGADSPTAESASEMLNQLADSGELDSVLWENENVAKEMLPVKNKLKIFQTANDLYSFHSNIIRGVISKLDEKHKIYEHGDPQRDFILADYWKHEPILAGAVYSMSAKMSTLTWQLIGTKRLASYYADVYTGMLHMNGAGWGDGISATAQDFYTTDRGAFWITPRYGSHLTGKLAEIGVMDSLSCAMTGNMHKPVLYSSYVTGQDLWLRPGEYAHFASMVSPREEFFGIGLCAVSRAYRAARILMGLSDYDWEKLNNMPPEGVAAVSGLTQDEFQDSLELWRAARQKNKNLTYPQVLWLLGSQPNTNVSIDFVGFSQIPEAFTRDKVIEQYVNTLALDFGVDSREFWPISTSSLGTAAESEIQHMKAKGKGPGEFIAVIERYLNGEQPDGVEFGFDTQDVGEDMAAATLAKTWIEALMPLYTGGQKAGAPPNPMKGPGGSAAEPPGTTMSINKEDGSNDKIITKDDLLQLLVDRKVLPHWIIGQNKRVVLTDVGIAEKELADIDPNQPIKIIWRATKSGGKFEYERLPAYEIQAESVANVPQAIILQPTGQNGSTAEFSASNGSLELKGGPGSGHWGHAGRPGHVGGSVNASFAMSLRTGRDAKARQQARRQEIIQPPADPKNELQKATKARQYYDVTDVEYLDDIAYPEDWRIPMNVMESYEDLDKTAVGEYGGGYFITKDGTLVDITPEFGAGTNDHPGGQIAISNPAIVNISYNSATKLARENLEDEFGDKWMEAYEGVWSELQKTNTRVYVGKSGLELDAIQSPTMDNKTLKQIQQWAVSGKLPPSTGSAKKIYWESWDGSGWLNATYGNILSANSLDDFTSDELAIVKEIIAKEYLLQLKQLADELVEDGLERNIHGSPLPAGESLRGPRVTRTAVKNELEKWRKHPVLSQYVPTLEENAEVQAILEKV